MDVSIYLINNSNSTFRRISRFEIDKIVKLTILIACFLELVGLKLIRLSNP